MEPKKNPKKQLGKKSVIFFQVGLILVLLIAWRAIEWKTYEKSKVDHDIVQFDQLDEEDVPVTEIQNKPPPPPPPPPAPEQIEVVPDDEEIEEEQIESTEDVEEPEIAEVEEVQEAPTEEKIEDVPFTALEDVPIFPGCEKYDTNKERKTCMSEKIKEFVNKRFNTDLASDLGLSGVNRVYVRFKIDEHGKIVDVQARSPEARLQQEAERVVKMLPTMKPGEQRGKPVGVLYSLPIVFQVQ